jgi:hypothetical protein
MLYALGPERDVTMLAVPLLLLSDFTPLSGVFTPGVFAPRVLKLVMATMTMRD